MLPEISGVPTYFLMWGVAATVGIGVGFNRARANGFPPIPSAFVLALLAMSLVAGAKLLYLGEVFLFPGDDPISESQGSVTGLLTHGFRNPGGIVLLGAAMFFACHFARLPWLEFGDCVIPAAGIAIVAFRLGCFFNGCCFAHPSDWPLSVSFPSGSRVFYWQVISGLVPPTAPKSLPVPPLQLYYAGLGAVLYVITGYLYRRRLSAGIGLLVFYLVFFVGTLLLELMQVPRLHLNLILCIVGLAVLGVSVFFHTGTFKATIIRSNA